MSLEKLKEVPQALWLGSKGYSKDGICFYMSEYVQNAMWKSVTYATARSAASASAPVAIMNSGKARNLSDRTRARMFTQWQNYSSQSLQDSTIYRIALWFGAPADAPPTDVDPLNGRNHAAVVAVGKAGTFLLFEPNFGFYEAIDPATDSRTLLERTINGLYASDGDVARNFIYLRGDALKSA